MGDFDSHTNFTSLVGTFVGLVNLVIPLLIGVALVAFFVGIVRYVFHASDAHGKGEDKEILLWGLVALFVLTSLWGILAVLQSAFLGGAGPCPGGGAGLC